MRKATAVEFWETEAAIARALGLSRTAVNKWGEVVPLESAEALETLSNGAVLVIRELYPALLRADQIVQTNVA